MSNDQPTIETLQAENDALRSELSALRARTRLLDALASISPDFIAVVDREGTYRTVLPTLVATPEVLQGEGVRMHQALPAELADRFVELIRATLESGQPGSLTYDFPSPGRTLWYTATVAAIDADNALWIARDVTQQHELEQSESQRASLQEQIIEAQRATLRELSTPLIPLADNVVVMPIVGTIDSTRAQQIMEVLLEGIAQYQCDAVLLDISGVRVVDTQVADALLRAAKAVKLLGAQVILTGISAEIAQTIVHLGADMGTIITQSNLQTGLRYAIDRYATGWESQTSR